MDTPVEVIGGDSTVGPGFLRVLAEQSWADAHRPRFHFVPPHGWLNDPNGVCQWNGRFHLFYQFNPSAPVHDNIHWGHASSADLIHWIDEPIALRPSPGGPDEDGCWSGALVNDDGTPTLVYSGHRDRVGQRPCLAVGSADLRTWHKHPDNPVIAATPPGLDIVEFRDHCVWRESGTWRQLIGSGIKGRGGTALLYESADLRSWTYKGPIVVGDITDTNVWTGSMRECVDLFRLGDSQQDWPDVLLTSTWHDDVLHHSVYSTGRLEGDTFTLATKQHLDLGRGYFYAPQSMKDTRARRIAFGWIPEGRTETDAAAAGWAGVISLPRQITMAADGSLVQHPVEEVKTLRQNPRHYPRTSLRPGESRSLPAITGDQLDIEATLRLTPGGVFELRFRASPDALEQTRLIIESPRGETSHVQVSLDRRQSSLDATVDAEQLAGTAPMAETGEIRIRVILDRSAVEVFVNGRPLTSRIYPTRPDALGVIIAAQTAEAAVDSICGWAMADIWDGPRVLPQ